MKKSREDIMNALENNREVVRSYGVRRLGLFGSCSRNIANASSDLDFVVEFNNKSFDAYMDLKDFLEQLLGSRVDLVLTETIKPRLREAILGDAVYVPGL